VNIGFKITLLRKITALGEEKELLNARNDFFRTFEKQNF
jgi:hypothetical protein